MMLKKKKKGGGGGGERRGDIGEGEDGQKSRILNDIGNFENPKIALIISVMV